MPDSQLIDDFSKALGQAKKFTYNVRSGRYHDERGRMVSFETAMSVFETKEKVDSDRLTRLAIEYKNGNIGSAVWMQGTMDMLRKWHVQQAAHGAGGFSRLQMTDFRRITMLLEEDRQRLVRFGGQIPQMGDGQIQYRINLYLGNGRREYWRSKRLPKQATKEGWTAVEKRTLVPGDNCAWCVHVADLGWQPYGLLPYPGEIDQSWYGHACLTNCRCKLERRYVKEKNLGKYVTKPFKLVAYSEAKAWDEDQERWPAGTPGGLGGQFKPSDLHSAVNQGAVLVGAYLGKELNPTVRIVQDDEFTEKFGGESEVTGGTAAFRSDDGTIYFPQSSNGEDVIHEFLHDGGMLPQGISTEWNEGITQAYARQFGKLGFPVRDSYGRSADMVETQLFPLVGDLQDFAKGYAASEDKAIFVADTVFSNYADKFSDTEEWGINPKARFVESLRSWVGGHNVYLDSLSKAWDEAKHPRDWQGRFTDKDESDSVRRDQGQPYDQRKLLYDGGIVPVLTEGTYHDPAYGGSERKYLYDSAMARLEGIPNDFTKPKWDSDFVLTDEAKQAGFMQKDEFYNTLTKKGHEFVTSDGVDGFYRGMNQEELRSILAKGEIRSKGEYNLSFNRQGATVFCTDFNMAASYADGFAVTQFQPRIGKYNGYVVKVRKPENPDAFFVNSVNEVEVLDGTDSRDIVGIWEIREIARMNDPFDTRDQWTPYETVYRQVPDADVQHLIQGMIKTWDESKHPRDEQGRFTDADLQSFGRQFELDKLDNLARGKNLPSWNTEAARLAKEFAAKAVVYSDSYEESELRQFIERNLAANHPEVVRAVIKDNPVFCIDKNPVKVEDLIQKNYVKYAFAFGKVPPQTLGLTLFGTKSGVAEFKNNAIGLVVSSMDPSTIETFAFNHEIGHSINDWIARDLNSTWASFVKNGGNHHTSYSESSVSEAFSDSYAMYVATGGKSKLRSYRSTFSVLNSIFKELKTERLRIEQEAVWEELGRQEELEELARYKKEEEQWRLEAEAEEKKRLEAIRKRRNEAARERRKAASKASDEFVRLNDPDKVWVSPIPESLKLLEQVGEFYVVREYPATDYDALRRWMLLRGYVSTTEFEDENLEHLYAQDMAEVEYTDTIGPVKAYDPAQERYPKGHPKGGQWRDSLIGDARNWDSRAPVYDPQGLAGITDEAGQEIDAELVATGQLNELFKDAHRRKFIDKPIAQWKHEISRDYVLEHVAEGALVEIDTSLNVLLDTGIKNADGYWGTAEEMFDLDSVAQTIASLDRQLYGDKLIEDKPTITDPVRRAELQRRGLLAIGRSWQSEFLDNTYTGELPEDRLEATKLTFESSFNASPMYTLGRMREGMLRIIKYSQKLESGNASDPLYPFSTAGRKSFSLFAARLGKDGRIQFELTDAEDMPVSYNRHSLFVDQWAETSNDNSYISLEAQRVAGEMVGIKLSSWQKQNYDRLVRDSNKQGIDDNAPFEYSNFEAIENNSAVSDMVPVVSRSTASLQMRDAIYRMYQRTQNFFKKQGIKNLLVYRGVQLDESDITPELRSQLKKGARIKIESNAIEAWTSDQTVAKQFAGMTTQTYAVNRLLLGAIIPVERILGTPFTGYGCMAENEVVLFGNPDLDPQTLVEFQPSRTHTKADDVVETNNEIVITRSMIDCDETWDWLIMVFRNRTGQSKEKAYDAAQPRYPQGHPLGGRWRPLGGTTQPLEPGSATVETGNPKIEANDILWPSKQDLQDAQWESLSKEVDTGAEGAGFFRVTTTDGRKWFVKTSKNQYKVDAERLTANVLRRFGLTAMHSSSPEYLPPKSGGKYGIIAPWLKDDYETIMEFNLRYESDEATAKLLTPEERVSIAVADFIVGNNDRHSGNIMVAKQPGKKPGYVLIDNGRFAETRYPGNSAVLYQHYFEGGGYEDSLKLPSSLPAILDRYDQTDISDLPPSAQLFIKAGIKAAKRLYTPYDTLFTYSQKLERHYRLEKPVIEPAMNVNYKPGESMEELALTLVAIVMEEV